MFTLDYKFQKDAIREMLQCNLGQVIAPTGTGKSKIQAGYLENKIDANPGFAVYLIVTPRILLTNQLMETVASDLVKQFISFKRVTIHSGTEVEFKRDEFSLEEFFLLKDFKSLSTTSSKTLKEEVKKAKRKDVPLLICSTYHSVDRVALALKGVCKVEAMLCDESQFVVQDDFFNSVKDVKALSNNAFFFTATQKRTDAKENGRGHNNEAFYGKPIFERTPKEMIDAGYMTRIRLHLVETTYTADNVVDVVMDSYREHRTVVNGDPKMLTVCKGSRQLRDIVTSKEFKTFARQQGQNFKYFDASSEFGYNINGEKTVKVNGKTTKITRSNFLRMMREHKGPAIVFHINMLAEGIDVPDFSGVLSFPFLKKAKLLQTIGRATRLHDMDREAFTKGEYLPSDISQMMKPFAYMIVPVFADEGADRLAFIMEILSQLRDYGFDPAEDVIIRKPNGIGQVEPTDLTTKPDEKIKGNLFNTLFEIHHTLEDERVASMLVSDNFETVLDGVFEVT